jgi:calpain-15
MAVILEQPALLEKIFLTKDYCKEGCYLVRLCHNGEWKTVILDDIFPCDAHTGQLVYSKASRKQLWVPLIEKAMAKLNGSYESLIAGLTVEGLSTLTGFPCESLKLETGQNEEPIDKDMIWVRLLSMKDAGYIMGASCGRLNVEDAVFQSYGLFPRHAYSVLGVREVNNNRLIRLRNPWGKYAWKGDWSESSPRWTPELRRALNQPVARRGGNTNEEGGVFWMSFDDFVSFFCTVDICKTHLNWFESRMSSYFSPEGTREMIAYTLIVCETCEVNIGLFHKTSKNRHENSDLDLCFVVMKSSGNKNSVGKLVVSSKRSIRKFIGSEHLFEPGEYLIVPFSFNFWYTGDSLGSSNNLYNLVFHSSKAIYIEQEVYKVSTFFMIVL